MCERRGFARPIPEAGPKTMDRSHTGLPQRLHDPRQRHLAEPSARISADKYQAGFAWQLAQQVQCSWAQRHPMLTVALHPLGRDNPCLAIKVDLGPLSAKYFASPCRRENQKLQRPSCNTILLAQLHHELRQLPVIHSVMVLNRCQLTCCWQHLIKATLPAGGIGALRAMATDDSPSEYRLDAAAGPISGDALSFPDRLQRP